MILKLEVQVLLGMVLLIGLLRSKESYFGCSDGADLPFLSANHAMMMQLGM